MQPATTTDRHPSDFLAMIKRYSIAVWAVGITFVVTILISPLVPPDISSLFIVAVMISAWRGGLGAGLLATILSVLIDVFIFLPSRPTYTLESNADFVQLAVDIFAAVTVGALSASKSKSENGRKELLRREQSARIEAERANAVKDEFLGAVSHELRTPLTTIKTLTRILLRQDPGKSERQGFLEDIASECDRQINLVHNLLDLSRLKWGNVEVNFEAVDVLEVLKACEKIEHIEAAGRGQRITVETTVDLPDVCAERDALRRVICTMVENAIKYTPEGGNIKLFAEPDNAGDAVCIQVSDDGYGIDANDLPHIFESFYRGKTMTGNDVDQPKIYSVGLGLYLAKSLIDAMNGKVEVESKIGRGSTFTVRLPVWRGRVDRIGDKQIRSSTVEKENSL